MKRFDIAIVGGGPGGCAAAVHAVKNGKTVVLIERGTIGGTCLHKGCIPTKSLLKNVDVLDVVRESGKYGINIGGEITFDLKKMIDDKNHIVKTVEQNLKNFLAFNNVTTMYGRGKLLSKNEIKVSGYCNEIVFAKHIILAMGSEVNDIPLFDVDGERVHSSDSILNITKLPKDLVIIGGGIVGCEFASLFSRLNVKVSIIESLPKILSRESSIVSRYVADAFKKQGVSISTGINITSVKKEESRVFLHSKCGKVFSAEYVLVAAGRKLNTQNMGLDKAGVFVDMHSGAIYANNSMETNIPGIYAIGDITDNCALAHVASKEGEVAGKNASGRCEFMHYKTIPSAIFIKPEVASVGITEEQALAMNRGDVLIKALPFSVLGKAHANRCLDGFAQLIVNIRTGEILGAQIVGNNASDLITEIALAMEEELSVYSVQKTIHGHPTYSEIWLELATSILIR